MSKIRVLVVEDSLVFRQLLVDALNQAPGFEVVAVAEDPFQARDAIIECQPDVMTLDVELPRMSGIEFLRKLMPQYPLATVVISSLSDRVFDALRAGAVDFVAKPALSQKSQLEQFLKKELPAKVKAASMARLDQVRYKPKQENRFSQGEIVRKDMVVAIGASTGGTEAISTVIKGFGTDIPGVVVVQHMPPGFTEMYARRLDKECVVEVKEAKTGDVVKPGRVLIAPGGEEHMRLVRVGEEYQVILRRGQKVNGHCPSVDVLFQSVAETAGSHALGILLTGMGSDGARGLLKMRQHGARTIGQDESSCVVYGMPKVAYELGAVQYQEKLSEVARRTYSIINQK
ncbi:MAG: chemotaxis response regulator protein-glutamate methylesterase [Eubacterium sp.]|nr:chemotaxis response regulator protein-glutamate methylesterase [Eubacterium sp.]